MPLRRAATVRFAPDVPPARQEILRRVLAREPDEADRFIGYRRGVKDFYRVDSPAGLLFVKVRKFRTFLKRLRNTLRRTKDQCEFRQLVALRRAGVPCPAPLAVARVHGSLLVRETRFVTEFVSDAVPLSRALVEQTFSREALLDRLVDFFRLLESRGVVHRDLHWDNLLVRPSAGGGPEFLLVDTLHVRLIGPPAGAAFAPTVEWFVAFMLHRDAPGEVVEALLDRLGSLGLPALADRAALLDRARRTAALLRSSI